MEPNLSPGIAAHPHPSSPSTEAQQTRPNPQTALSENSTSTGVEPMAADGKDSRGAVARHPHGAGADVESQTSSGRMPRYSSESDPYGLASAYKTQTELEQIRANTSRKRAGATTGGSAGGGGGILAGCVPRLPLSQVQAQRIKTFYETQNAAIARLLKSVEEHRADARQEQGEDQLKVKIAVYGSFAANLALAVLQIYGAVSSGSLSLFTTMADAISDPLSNLTLIVINRAVRRVDPNRFPSGKARLETVGNIVYCFLLTAVSFTLISFSVQQLVTTPQSAPVNSFHLPSIVAVAVAFATKLVLFLYTWTLKDRYSQVDILWQDHRNDLLINGFGLLTSVGGSKLAWWVDPMGALILSCTVSFLWLRTAFAEFMLLVGVVASAETQQLITYVGMTHSPEVRQIDTVRVYHSGPRLIAEVDVVMDPDASLQATHDVAEALQMKLESLPDVERAYVHVDYETTHKPEHAYKKDL